MKITNETKLEAGMKVEFDKNKYEIIRVNAADLALSKLGQKNLALIGLFSHMSHLKSYLISEKAELIEENKKVIVSAEVAVVLEKTETVRKNIAFPTWIIRISNVINIHFNEWMESECLSNKDLLNIYENGWEVEKPKYQPKVGDIIVSNSSGWFFEVTESNIHMIKIADIRLACAAENRDDLKEEE